MGNFTVDVPQTFSEGWGVSVMPVYDWDDDESNERITDLEVLVARIAANEVQSVGGVACVKPEFAPYWVPVSNFRADLSEVPSDSHDARDRRFATEQEARDHAQRVLEEWANPTPWQSFVVID